MSPSLLHRFASTVVIALDVTVLRVGWVPPTHVLAHLSRPRRWVDAVGADGAALELARAGLWLAAVWLAVAVLAVLASIRPGTLGRVGDGVAARVVPALLRRIITAALGASVVLVPVAAGANTTAARSGTVAAVPVAVSSAPSPATATRHRVVRRMAVAHLGTDDTPDPRAYDVRPRVCRSVESGSVASQRGAQSLSSGAWCERCRRRSR